MIFKIMKNIHFGPKKISESSHGSTVKIEKGGQKSIFLKKMLHVNKKRSTFAKP